jgi:hypothetical protein
MGTLQSKSCIAGHSARLSGIIRIFQTTFHASRRLALLALNESHPSRAPQWRRIMSASHAIVIELEIPCVNLTGPFHWTPRLCLALCPWYRPRPSMRVCQRTPEGPWYTQQVGSLLYATCCHHKARNSNNHINSAGVSCELQSLVFFSKYLHERHRRVALSIFLG